MLYDLKSFLEALDYKERYTREQNEANKSPDSKSRIQVQNSQQSHEDVMKSKSTLSARLKKSRESDDETNSEVGFDSFSILY